VNIVISAFATDRGRSGISQYAANIIGHMVEHAPADNFIALASRADAAWVQSWHPRLRVIPVADRCAVPVVNICWHLFALPFHLLARGADVVFYPAGNRRVGWFPFIPSVGVVHDLSPLHVPGKYDRFRMFYLLKVLPLLIRRLDAVIAVSQATRRDLLDYAKVSAGRVTVIHNGIDHQRFNPGMRHRAKKLLHDKFNIPAPFILYTARLEHPGKNHIRLLEAFALIKRGGRLNHKLVLVGGHWNGAEKILERVRALDLDDDVILTGFVANEDLPSFYAAADLFVFPSLFEGFGIPVIEAMASGTPVCAADNSSLPEIIADAGLLFPAEDINAMRAAIEAILFDPGCQQELSAAGKRQAGKFDWRHGADRTYDVIRKTASEARKKHD